MSSPVDRARDEINEALGAVDAARSADPDLDGDLSAAKTALTAVRDQLEAQTEAPANQWFSEPLYKSSSSSWETALSAVLTAQIHLRGAKAEIFGDEETPSSGLSDADQLRSDVTEAEGRLDAARQTLRAKAP